MKAMTKTEPKTTAPKATPKVQRHRDAERPILYPEVAKFTYHAARNAAGEKDVRPGLTAEKAMKLLDWEDEDMYRKRKNLDEVDNVFGATFEKDTGLELHKDKNGKKFVCWNNIDNRAFNPTWSEHICQDILNRKFVYNGQAMTFGKTGKIISARHRLIALVWAKQIWEQRGASTDWHRLWPTEPTIDTDITVGLDETQELRETTDETLARSAADSFYTSEVFADKAPGEKKDLARYMDHAIGLLWKRTGAGDSAMIEKIMTHSAMMGFLERHPRLKKAVLHIFDQNKDKAITMLRLYCGHAAAMLYLMGARETDGDAYRNVDPAPHEKKIDWAAWEKAREFWNLVGAKSKQLDPLYFALGQIVADEDGGGKTEMLGTVCKAWNAFADGKPLIAEELRLATTFDTEKQVKSLAEFPDFGGIDLGPGIKGRAEAIDPEAPANVPETAEQLKARQAEEAIKLVEEAKRKKGAIPLSDAELLAKRKEQAAKIEANRKATGGKPAPFKAPVPKPNAASGKPPTKKPAAAPAAK